MAQSRPIYLIYQGAIGSRYRRFEPPPMGLLFVVVSLTTPGDGGAAAYGLGASLKFGLVGMVVGFLLSFLFTPDLSHLTAEGVLTALGHAFFTLSLGMGAIMVYGSYMPGKTSIASTTFTIAFMDTLVALVAGMAIFPIVFASSSFSGVSAKHSATVCRSPLLSVSPASAG